MNVKIGNETPIFFLWEYLFRKFGILSLQCIPGLLTIVEYGEPGVAQLLLELRFDGRLNHAAQGEAPTHIRAQSPTQHQIKNSFKRLCTVKKRK
jgi:hypothetical protein